MNHNFIYLKFLENKIFCVLDGVFTHYLDFMKKVI